MKRAFLFVVALSFVAVFPAQAMEYYPDPVYEKLAPEDSHPMDDMIAEAKEGDARAQFILGDLYSKGKGGLPKDDRKAYGWFNTSAKSGYAVSFVRLAALAKRQKKSVEAYKWYVLAADYIDDRDWHKYVVSARDEWVESAKLTDEQKDEAKKQANLWISETRKERAEMQEQKRKAENLKKAAEREAKKAAESAAKKEAAESAVKKEVAKKSSQQDQSASSSVTSKAEKTFND